MKSEKLVWFARGGGIGRMGPYKSHEEAAAHIMVHAQICAINIWPHRTPCNCQLRPVDGAFVWPEVEKRRQCQKTR
jgi:hypothetical protein